MAKRMFQIGAIITAITLVATASLTVMATGDGSGGSDSGGQGGDSGGRVSGFLSHLHDMVGQHMHHGGGHHGGGHQHHLAQVIEQLELTPDQVQRLEKVHETIRSFGSEGHASMAQLHDQLVGQVEQGYVETDEVRQIIDGQLEQVRGVAYAVTDELVALVNELDATQRETLLEHLESGDDEGHGGSGEHGH